MSTLRSAMVLISGNGVGFFLRFARNVLLARLISVEDYGIASTFLVATTLVTMATDLDLGKYLVQERRGNDPDFVAVVKTMGIIRGIFVSFVIFAMAAPMARLFNQPELIWAYQVIALGPLILSFQHPDITRFARMMNFKPRMINNAVSGVAVVLLIWPLSMLLHDFRVVLAIIVLEACFQLGLSFLQAERPYRLGWRKEVAKGALIFGWPLMLSGLVVFAILQGDRIIVANQYGARELGYFSAALNLVMPAALAAAGLVRNFFLPLLARFQDRQAEFDHRALFTIQSSLCATQLAILTFAFAGPAVIVLVYGENYRPAVPMIGWLGIAMALQLARAGTATVAIARGHTTNMLIANLIRIAFLPVALAVAVAGGDIQMMLIVGAVGQIVGYAVSVVLLYKKTGLGRPKAMVAPISCCAASLLCLAGNLLLSGAWGVAEPSFLGALAILFFLAQIATSRVMVIELRRIFKDRGRR